MNNGTTFVGLDVHRKTITGTAITADGEICELGTFPNTPQEVAKRVQRWGAPAELAVAYEAGPCGYPLARQLRALGIACQVVAPALLPRRPGDRIKNDRRDALQLAQLLASAMVTTVPVPTVEQEALRALSRARELAGRERHRSRQHLITFLAVQGVGEPDGTRWTQRWWRWADALQLDQPAAQVVLDDYRAAVRRANDRLAQLTTALADAAQQNTAAPRIAQLRQLHGIGLITAVGIVAEAGELQRFSSAPALMAYTGLVSREHSSGPRQHRGAITRAGNSHLRFLLVEAAWHYSRPLPKRQPSAADPVSQIAQRARIRLHHRFWHLVNRGKPRQVAIVAVARELAGFIWAVGQVPVHA